MANISNAFGEITINANSIDAIKNFIILQREFNKHKDYQTELATFILSDSGLEEDITDYTTTTANSQFIYEDKFTASSRWNFENNVKHFLDALEISNDDSNELRILKKAITSVLTLLTKNQDANFYVPPWRQSTIIQNKT